MKIEKLADLPYYTEGPVCDDNGTIFFTAPGGGMVYRMEANGKHTVWAELARPNGQLILGNGDHLICESRLGVLKRYDPGGRWIGDETCNTYGGDLIFAPNDLAVDPDGGIYFTDSVRKTGKVWFKSLLGKMRLIAKDLDYPNGIAYDPVQHCLYVAESYQNRILRIYPDETVQRPITVFANLPCHYSGKEAGNLPDGLALDEHNNLWVAHYGMGAVQVLSKQGRLEETILTGLPLTSNVFLTRRKAIITGGYGEPGPGAVMVIYR